MNWIKKGLLFNSNQNSSWINTGAMIPTPVILKDHTIRIFLTFLDREGIGRTGFIDIDPDDFSNIKKISKSPVFEIGEPGTFDESGVLTCSVVETESGDYYFYYAGFELGTKIRYRLLTGLAITDNYFNLKNKFKAPVLERSEDELFFRGGPFVLRTKSGYKMWYVGGSDWINIKGKQMPVYEILYAESEDGINWPSKGIKCITINSDIEHGFGRPYVIIENNTYKMFYSIRVVEKGYRLGYAESKDGINWIRQDDKINLDVSNSGFDSNMICYSAVIKIKNNLIMFYNGNDFGKTGLGYAVLKVN
jgi:hypothetical protein